MSVSTSTGSQSLLGLLLFGLVHSVTAACSADETLTITKASQISSLASSCATYSGGIEIWNLTGTIDLTGVETVIGDIRYENILPDVNDDASEDASEDVTIASSTLRNVSHGSIIVNGPSRASGFNGRALNISLPALKTADKLDVSGRWEWHLGQAPQGLSVNTDPELEIGAFIIEGDGETMVADLYVNLSSTNLFVVAATQFDPAWREQGRGAPLISSSVKLSNSLSIFSNDGLTRLLLDSLKNVTDKILIAENLDLDYISSSLVGAAGLSVYGNGRHATVSLPNLKKLDGRSQPYPNDPGGHFADAQNISLPQLREVYGPSGYMTNLSFESNQFLQLRLPRLETANCSFRIQRNVALNGLWLPRLSLVDYFWVNDNPELLNVTANLLKKAQSVNMTGLFTNVELFNLEEVTGDFYLAGDEAMDCSWFDEHFRNKVVAGSYECIGNHTKPETERTPSTPTDLAQLEAWEEGNGFGGGNSIDEGDPGSGAGSTTGLSSGAKAGIGSGLAVVVWVALVLGAWFFLRRQKKKERDAANSHSGFQKPELDGKSRPAPVGEPSNPAELADTGKAELPDTGKAEALDTGAAEPAEPTEQLEPVETSEPAQSFVEAPRLNP